MADLRPRLRLPMLLLGMLSLVVGVLAGLARLGLEVPVVAQINAGGHGALMIAAFFGTVISLERAVALARGWPYLAPLCAGIGGTLLVAGAPLVLAQSAFVLAAAVLCAASAWIVRQQPALFTLTLAIGAAAWLGGNGVWLAGSDLSAAVPFWIDFLLLTIAGERLELTRFMPVQALARRLFVAIVAVIAFGTLLSGYANGLRLHALGLLALALWLLRYDIARRTVRQQGLTRFIAVCLLSGYLWLGVAGLLGLGGAFAAGHVWRDAALHAVFLGFVFSMVLGHAAIIFPAVMQVKIPYHAAFYLPLLALHASLLLRLAAGLADYWALRPWSGIANALALLLFILTILSGVLRGRREAVGSVSPERFSQTDRRSK
ncbi:MAG: hypothetical protein M0P39_05860 [Rhodocyclaceae bacterium]|nr:hypothetical protein [Rhodocyclaceae bacterium]